MNFAAQRSSVYPDEFLSLVDKLGIDPAKEGEVYEVGPSVYGGWFYLTGELTESASERSRRGHRVHDETAVVLVDLQPEP